MKNILNYSVLILLAIGLMFSSNAIAAKKNFFEGLTGSWKGKGFVVTSAGAKEEAVRCRLRNRTADGSAKLVISGSCGIGGVLIPMTGWIKQKGKSSKYTASLFKSLAFLRIDQFAGRLKGKKLSLRFKGRDKISKENISVFITILGKNKNRFDIRLSSTDTVTKKVFSVGTIKFSRK